MPMTSTQPMELRAAAPGAGDKDQHQMAKHRGGGGHQHRAQPRGGGTADGVGLGHTLLLQAVGKLDDEDAVLGDEADQRD
jgi:hypothetical protein